MTWIWIVSAIGTAFLLGALFGASLVLAGARSQMQQIEAVIVDITRRLREGMADTPQSHTVTVRAPMSSGWWSKPN